MEALTKMKEPEMLLRIAILPIFFVLLLSTAGPGFSEKIFFGADPFLMTGCWGLPIRALILARLAA
jgi:hypothetical protein